MSTARLLLSVALLCGLVLMTACGGDPGSGPAPMIWDRDVCQRCQMLVSDPDFAAQVRSADGRAHRFDDIGCALLWIDAGEAGGEPREIWVREHGGDEWLAADAARFVKVANSPMGYGYGARQEAPPESLDLAALRRAIRELEDARRSHPR